MKYLFIPIRLHLTEATYACRLVCVYWKDRLRLGVYRVDMRDREMDSLRQRCQGVDVRDSGARRHGVLEALSCVIRESQCSRLCYSKGRDTDRVA